MYTHIKRTQIQHKQLNNTYEKVLVKEWNEVWACLKWRLDFKIKSRGEISNFLSFRKGFFPEGRLHHPVFNLDSGGVTRPKLAGLYEKLRDIFWCWTFHRLMCDQDETKRVQGRKIGVKREYLFVLVNYQAAELWTIWICFTDNCFGQIDKVTLQSRQEEKSAGIFVFVSLKDRNGFILETFLIW